MSDILEKLSKVLAMADGTDNEHEADAFIQHAQFLAAKYSIDLALVRQASQRRQRAETPIQTTIDIGSSGAMGNSRFVTLFCGIAASNDVVCDIAHNCTYVLAYGYPSDLEVVEALYVHLSLQMVEAANAYLRTGAYKEERVWDPRARGYKPVSAKTARLSFYDAFTTRVRSRLAQARQDAEQDAIAADRAHKNTVADIAEPVTTGTELALADKRAHVRDFHKEKSRAKGSFRGPRPSMRSGHAADAGRRAGESAQLRSTRRLPGARREIA